MIIRFLLLKKKNDKFFKLDDEIKFQITCVFFQIFVINGNLFFVFIVPV